MYSNRSRASAMSRFAVKCLPIILFLGASSATLAEQEHPGTHKKVYLLRGLTNVLSPGIDQLADELRKRNISATVTNHLFWNSLANEALQDCRSDPESSIILVGHSLGASAVVSMAEQLQLAGGAARRAFPRLTAERGPKEQCRPRTRFADHFAFDSEAGHE
jgi:surfactin synthase thioesterase subunit